MLLLLFHNYQKDVYIRCDLVRDGNSSTFFIVTLRSLTNPMPLVLL
jgi:hypothetical protein